MRLTYWTTSRDAPPPGPLMLVVGIEGPAVLQLVFDGPPDPNPQIALATNEGAPLRRLTTSGMGIAGPGGRYLWIAVFTPPPEGITALRLTATLGDYELTAWLYPTWSEVQP